MFFILRFWSFLLYRSHVLHKFWTNQCLLRCIWKKNKGPTVTWRFIFGLCLFELFRFQICIIFTIKKTSTLDPEVQINLSKNKNNCFSEFKKCTEDHFSLKLNTALLKKLFFWINLQPNQKFSLYICHNFFFHKLFLSTTPFVPAN